MQDNVFDGNTLSALKRLKNAIEKSSRIAVLTGAGVSVPSGIPDFAVQRACILQASANTERKT